MDTAQVLYGTGWIHVNDTVMQEGILYDAKKLLHDVDVMVQQARAAEAKK